MNFGPKKLWGENVSCRFLLLASFFILLSFLGAREIWTQEHRWADIVTGMFYRHDFFHPYLNQVDYYDKPLLSYWLIAGLSYISGQVSLWSLRLPSAIAGIIAVWSIYRLGSQIKNKSLGLLAGWLLLTTFYFIFWARTSSADMLNMSGSLLAVTWYAEKKDSFSFRSYFIFFLILAITSLCKGLVGAVVPILAILPDVLRSGWKKHVNMRALLGMISAAFIYFIPFWLSSHFGSNSYKENGLYLVYRENILRYFHPFDHQGPIYTYFIFLPIYLLPWTLFFIPAIVSLKSRWQTMTWNSQWLVYACLILFLFFTLSGSRRSYYILPLIPFALLMTADWILTCSSSLNDLIAKLISGSLLLLLIVLAILQPLYYRNGISEFAKDLKNHATKIQPWSDWEFVMLDSESKIRFYLHLSPEVKELSYRDTLNAMSTEKLYLSWPILRDTRARHIIFISRKKYEPFLKSILVNDEMVAASPSWGQSFFQMDTANLPIAFIPKKNISA